MFQTDERTFTAFESEYKTNADGFYRSKAVAKVTKSGLIIFEIVKRVDDGYSGSDRVIDHMVYNPNNMKNRSIGYRLAALADGLVTDREAAKIIDDAFISLILHNEYIDGFDNREIWLKEFPHLLSTVSHMREWYQQEISRLSGLLNNLKES